jgi:D-amino peptidase
MQPAARQESKPRGSGWPLLLLLPVLCAPPALAQDEEGLRVFISVDMEGLSGIAHSEMTSAAGAEYGRGRDLMMSDVNAAIQGALDAGATEILVNDSHGSMRNIRVEQLLPPARLISHNSKPFGMMQGLDSSFDAVFFIGYHARAGNPDGLMAHTGSGASVREIRVAGQPSGEGDMNAMLAAHHGVPVALATGDEAFVTELGERLTETEFVAVKRAIRRTTAELLHPEVAAGLIRDAASRALGAIPEPPPAPGSPVEIEIQYTRPDLAEIASLLPQIERVAPDRVRFEAGDMAEGYAIIRVLYRNLSE